MGSEMTSYFRQERLKNGGQTALGGWVKREKQRAEFLLETTREKTEGVVPGAWRSKKPTPVNGEKKRRIWRTGA